jgi:hypothetical protein
MGTAPQSNVHANDKCEAIAVAEHCPTAIAHTVMGRCHAAITVLVLSLLWWFDPTTLNLPLCWFHTWTGLDCPGCGATRATHELLHGRLMAAWHYNALWVLSLPLVVYMAVSELRLATGHRPLPGDLPRRQWIWIGIVMASFLFFVIRNLPWALL